MTNVIWIFFVVGFLALKVHSREFSYCDGSGASYHIPVFGVDISPVPVVYTNYFTFTTYVYLTQELDLSKISVTYQVHYDNGLSEFLGYTFCSLTKCPNPPVESGAFTLFHSQPPAFKVPTEVKMQIEQPGTFGSTTVFTCISVSLN